MLQRHLIEFGVQPIIGMILISLVFIGLSIFLYTRTIYAGFIYAFFALVLVSRSSEVQRNNVLKLCFGQTDYKIVRLIENGILALPFAIFLLVKNDVLISVAVLILALALSLINIENRFAYVTPTPFYKRPFEFIVGFRKTFIVILFAYSLMLISISVDNFNLGVFSLAVVILTSMTYYSNMEHTYFVWIFNRSPKEFLIEKIKTAWWHMTVLCIPILLGLGYFNVERMYILAIIMIVGFLYLAAIVLAKYAGCPDKISFPQGILLACGLWFPPLLLGIIPYFYQRSIKQLQLTLS